MSGNPLSVFYHYVCDVAEQGGVAILHWEPERCSRAADDLLACAAFFGAGNVLVLPGCFEDGEDEATCLRKIYDGLEAVCRKAKDYAIDVTIENFGIKNSPNGPAAGCLACLDAVEGLQFAFDTGNFSCYGEDPHAAYERLRGRISFVHLKDRPAGPDGVDPQVEAPTGDGALDLGRLVRRMIADGYAGAFAVEHFGHPDQESAMRRSAAFCRRLLGGS